MVVPMRQLIPDAYDLAHTRDPSGDLGMIAVQAVQRFANDLELAIHRSLGSVIVEIRFPRNARG